MLLFAVQFVLTTKDTKSTKGPENEALDSGLLLRDVEADQQARTQFPVNLNGTASDPV